jgi:predicted nucleic acid-binding protein
LSNVLQADAFVSPPLENPLDKQIAATAIINDLTVVTRNIDHYRQSPWRKSPWELT